MKADKGSTVVIKKNKQTLLNKNPGNTNEWNQLSINTNLKKGLHNYIPKTKQKNPQVWRNKNNCRNTKINTIEAGPSYPHQKIRQINRYSTTAIST